MRYASLIRSSAFNECRTYVCLCAKANTKIKYTNHNTQKKSLWSQLRMTYLTCHTNNTIQIYFLQIIMQYKINVTSNLYLFSRGVLTNPWSNYSINEHSNTNFNYVGLIGVYNYVSVIIVMINIVMVTFTVHSNRWWSPDSLTPIGGGVPTRSLQLVVESPARPWSSFDAAKSLQVSE